MKKINIAHIVLIILLVLLLILLITGIAGCSGARLYSPSYSAEEIERQKVEDRPGTPILIIRF